MPEKIHLFPPLYINRVCKAVAEGSQYPIAVCLKICHFTKIVAKKSIAYIHEYETLHKYYTSIAIDILNHINSDHAALIALECATDLEPKSEPDLDCLQIAIRTENGTFIRNKRVLAILNGIWESSGFLEGHLAKYDEKFVVYDKVNFFCLLRDHYRSVPAMAVGKHIIQVTLFIIEVALITFFAIRRLGLTSTFEYYEVLLWAFGLSAAAETVYNTIDSDRLFEMNISDMSSLILGICFGILAGMRFYYLIKPPSIATQQTSSYDDVDLTFDTIYAVTVICAFLRLSTLFSMSKRFGTLLLIVKRMMRDIENFGVLWILFICGFVFAEYFYISEQIGFSFSDSLIEIFVVSTGGDSNFEKYSSTSTVSRHRAAMAQIFLVLLIIFGALLLINLFIAMMAKTFEELSDRANTSWSLNFGRFIIAYDRKNDILPPPFNLVVYIIALIWYIFEIPLVICGILRQPLATLYDLSTQNLSIVDKLSTLFKGQKDVWLCTYCHCVQTVKSDEERIDAIKKWMNRLGMDTRDRATILETNAELCEYCKRVKRDLERYKWITDHISYYIAYLTVLPLIFITTIPTGGIIRLYKRMIGTEKNDAEEFYRLLRERQKLRLEADHHDMRKLFTQKKRISQILNEKITNFEKNYE